jgi:hypothetical protein
MSIKWIPDLGAPVAVTAVDLLLETYKPTWNKWATGVLAVGGYVGSYMNFGGDFVKNVGIAALPAFAKNIYNWAKGGTASHATPVTFRRSVARYPAPALEPQFGGARLV